MGITKEPGRQDMYRAYQPLLPATNRYLQEKWDKAAYQEHRRKVELAVPVVNTTALPTPLHLQVNLKKIQLEKERQAIWDRENLLHYAKLWGIKQSRGCVDNWNFYCTRSLNWEKRQQELAHICGENQQLVKRLEGRKSELARECWQRDWLKEQLTRNRIAHYPRGAGNCQTRKETRRQWTLSSNIPASASGDGRRASPNRPHISCSRKNNSTMGKSFWGSGRESTPEVTATFSSSSSLRGGDVLQQPGALAQQSSKQHSVLPKATVRAFSGCSLETPLAEAVMATIKPPTSLRLRKKLGPSENSPMPTSRELEKKPELSAKKTEPCCGRAEKAPNILFTSLSVKPHKPFSRKPLQPPEAGCGKSCPLSPELPSRSCIASPRSDKSSHFLVKVCEASSSVSSSSSSGS